MRDSLNIKRLHLKDIARFNDIELYFDSKVTVVCGANGVGKTSILDAIASSVMSYNTGAYIRRRADAEVGLIEVTLESDGQRLDVSGPISTFFPEEIFKAFGAQQAAKNLIYLKASRDFIYSRKDSIKRDVDISDFEQQSKSLDGINADQIKDWFTNRYLMRPHGNDWPVHRKENLESAKSLFNVLDRNITLHGVDTSTFDIKVNTPAGIIPYEYLSSGFRSAFAMLLGIIKEIEYRKLDVSVGDFSGIILVDEIDLHLHPTWQSKILSVMKDVFKRAQIIVTTHSPHVVQSAKAAEVISILVDDKGQIYPEKFKNSKYGFVGWSIEEILTDVMGVVDTNSSIYREAVSNFNKAIESENFELVNTTYNILCEMLHPSSPLRKVFFLQASQFLDTKSDDIFDQVPGHD